MAPFCEGHLVAEPEAVQAALAYLVAAAESVGSTLEDADRPAEVDWETQE